MNTPTDLKPQDIVTVDEFFRLIALKEDTFKENTLYLAQIETFRTFIKSCQELEAQGLEPESSTSYLNDFYRHAVKLQQMQEEERTELQQEVIKMVPEELLEKEKEMIRTRNIKPSNNSGYVNAFIILVVLLNIGFILAMTILAGR